MLYIVSLHLSKAWCLIHLKYLKTFFRHVKRLEGTSTKISLCALNELNTGALILNSTIYSEAPTFNFLFELYYLRRR